MFLAYEDFTFAPGALIVAAVLYRVLRRREGLTPRAAAVRSASVFVAACLIAWGATELLEAFGDAVGEYEGE